MNVLDSPLEALAFNYATFGFSTLLNNLWAWAALLTAALSLWKIRPKSYFPPSTPHTHSSEHHRPLQPFVPPEAPGTRRPAVVASGDGDADGVTKGKFTVYYGDEAEEEEESLMEREREEWCKCKSWEWWEDWEKMLRVRSGESGWYKYQDLTELNGNVVRLWDDAVFRVRNADYCITVISELGLR
ncbi:Transmembrane protein [Senna tora]|uniref:Transmembrane protein n=1 Tax=Senna tora TaxID=362788 RepID=A0A835CBZ2_9FABA|nr:Transmembrane protein [Senna tora]